MLVLTKRKRQTMSAHPCILLHIRAIAQLCSACWTPVLTKKRRATMASHHCILLRSTAIRELRTACWTRADREQADNDGGTPLHLAAQHGHQWVVQYLLDAGADAFCCTSRPVIWYFCLLLQRHPIFGCKSRGRNAGNHQVLFLIVSGGISLKLH